MAVRPWSRAGDEARELRGKWGPDEGRAVPVSPAVQALAQHHSRLAGVRHAQRAAVLRPEPQRAERREQAVVVEVVLPSSAVRAQRLSPR
jgi:hypothetical protein